ncbi:MAG: hypothetical protein RR060_01455 [Victivallaceae bacterium]
MNCFRKIVMVILLCVMGGMLIPEAVIAGNDKSSTYNRNRQKSKQDKERKNSKKLSSREEDYIKNLRKNLDKVRQARAVLSKAEADGTMDSNESGKALQYLRGISRTFDTNIVRPFKSQLKTYFKAEDEFQAKKESGSKNLDRYEKEAQKEWDSLMLYKPILVEFYNAGGIIEPKTVQFMADEGFIKLPEQKPEENDKK